MEVCAIRKITLLLNVLVLFCLDFAELMALLLPTVHTGSGKQLLAKVIRVSEPQSSMNE